MKRNYSISIVDDDESMRESLESLLKSMGFRVSRFSGAEEFLDARAADRTDCLILDVRLGGMSGPELQTRAFDRSSIVARHFHHDTMVTLGLMALTAS